MLVVQPGAPYDMTLAGQKRTLPITFNLANTRQCETRTGDDVGHLAGKRDHPAGHTVPRRACTERNLQQLYC